MAIWVILSGAFLLVLIVGAVVLLVMVGTGEKAQGRLPGLRRAVGAWSSRRRPPRQP